MRHFVKARRKYFALPAAGAGGDLQPLLALIHRLCGRGHDLVVFGNTAVASAVASLNVETVLSGPEHDLGPRLTAARNDTISLPPEARGHEVGRRLAAWAEDVAPAAERVVKTHRPDALLTSFFGGMMTKLVAESTALPWVVVNSTFYVGTMRLPLEEDFFPRTRVMFRDFLIPPMECATLVLHATDQKFDFDFQDLPPRHHYVGPLLWEPPGAILPYVGEPGPPWVLVSLSSDPQDDLPIAQGALAALASRPVRVLVTIGNVHDPRQLAPLPANARVERYAPHGALLDRAALLIGHAGHGSVMKALWAGVPMVLVPWDRDQPGVARRAQWLGVTVVIQRDGLSHELLGRAIERVLQDSRYSDRAAKEALRLRASDPGFLASEHIEQL
jgi:UDP:flavonoid glycosyltransferase YjiC (YdhE family)